MTDYRKAYYQRTVNHIIKVNEYAKKIGMEFPNHDRSKLTSLFEPYALWSKTDRTAEEDDMLNQATLIHIKSAPHHPEYWTNTPLNGFTRRNYTPNGIIDASDMPDECIAEMVCDWCAMGDEMHNSTRDWFKVVNGKRWLFNEHQQSYILELLDKLQPVV